SCGDRLPRRRAYRPDVGVGFRRRLLRLRWWRWRRVRGRGVDEPWDDQRRGGGSEHQREQATTAARPARLVLEQVRPGSWLTALARNVLHLPTFAPGAARRLGVAASGELDARDLLDVGQLG